eukprot:jgi/Psemu1/3845/gm1.3845_g
MRLSTLACQNLGMQSYTRNRVTGNKIISLLKEAAQMEKEDWQLQQQLDCEVRAEAMRITPREQREDS